MTVVEGKLRVYIVEDSPIFLKALENLLAENDRIAIVGRAGEASLAMREIPRLAPEVVILDFHLTSGTGLDVLKSIKAEPIKMERQASPIAIMFSSHAEAAFRRVSMRLGADFFFEKSREFDLLAQLLRSMTSSPPRCADGPSADRQPKDHRRLPEDLPRRSPELVLIVG